MKKRSLIFIALFLSACADNPGVDVQTPGGGAAVSTTTTTSTTLIIPLLDHIHLTPNGAISLTIGNTRQFTAVAHDAGHGVISGVAFTWVSSNPGTASIVGTGSTAIVSGDTVGPPATSDISAQASGISSSATDPATVTVTCNGIPSIVSSVVPGANPISTLASVQIAVTVDDCDPFTPPDVPDGTLVTFSLNTSTLGSMSSPNATTVGGVANGTFTASNAFGDVTITASVTVNGVTFSNSAILTIIPTPINSIEFTSATPPLIGLQGSGSVESSQIVFTVRDVNGNPASDGTNVIFTLIGPGGTSTATPQDIKVEALTFYNTATVNGAAKTIMTSGLITGTARVIACVDIDSSTTCDPGEPFSTSTTVSIGGGIPSATHFSLARTLINLPGGPPDHIVNEQSELSAFVGDRFANFNILAGTAVSFVSEAGAVDTAGITDSTGITFTPAGGPIILRTQNPKPYGNDRNYDINVLDPLNPITGEFFVNANFSDYDGPAVEDADQDGCWDPATVSFGIFGPYNDANGNGVRDFGEPPGEMFEDVNNDGCYDPGEPFVDADTDPTMDGYDYREFNPRDGWVTVIAYTRGEESFQDLNGNGIYDFPSDSFVDNGGEPFIDANDNGIWDRKETFVDSNFNGSYDRGEAFTDWDPGEPYFDADLSGTYTAGEPFTDLNGDGLRDATGTANLVYDPGELFIDVTGPTKDLNGQPIKDLTWTHGNGAWDGPGSPFGDEDTTIWVEAKFVFSGAPNISPLTSRIYIHNNSMDPNDPSSFVIANGGCARFTVYVMDSNGNALSPGSTITITADQGTIFGGGTIEILDGVSEGPIVFPVSVCDDDPVTVEPKVASLTVEGTWETQFAGSIPFNLGFVTGISDYFPVTITTTTFPDAVVGGPYSVPLQALGGLRPYVWSVPPASLPNGLVLDSTNGTISGSATIAAACPVGAFDLTVTDFLGATDTKTVCINVVP